MTTLREAIQQAAKDGSLLQDNANEAWDPWELLREYLDAEADGADLLNERVSMDESAIRKVKPDGYIDTGGEPMYRIVQPDRED